MQDPATSTWRIELSGTSHLPSPAHPRGRRISAASQWSEHNPWSFTDGERRDRAAEEMRLHELLIERKPMPPLPGEETRKERRERLLRSESEVEAFQEKERILEASYGQRVRKRSMEEGERSGEVGGTEMKEDAGSGVELGRPAVAAEVRRAVAGEGTGVWDESATGEFENSAVSASDLKKTVDDTATTTKTAARDAEAGQAAAQPGMTDDSLYTEEVIAANEQADRGSKILQTGLDFAASVLMLVGILGLYLTVTG